MKKALLAAMILLSTPALAEVSPSERNVLNPACFRQVTKAIAPAAVALTGDKAATVTDQGMPLEEKGQNAEGAKIYFKPLWKVVGNVDGFYRLNAGAYLVFKGKSCEVLGISLEPDIF
jgi:hypothetical protein